MYVKYRARNSNGILAKMKTFRCRAKCSYVQGKVQLCMCIVLYICLPVSGESIR